ncbi:MAG: EAL domain-containing protein [Actinomycetota bacterium]
MSELSHHHNRTHQPDLARALAEDEFELWFQPKVRLSDQRIIGAEGLARWQHPNRGLLTPGDFLADLRDSSLIRPFTSRMIEQAVTFAGEAKRMGHEIEVAVNLGPRSFIVPGLADYIRSLLARHGVSPRCLVIEITEEDLLDETQAAHEAFDALARLGVQLSIDDFGTGYSSLARLRRLPVDELKIDQEFVGALGTDDEDTVIVRTIIELARLLNHVTVAEGIETTEQLDILRRLGCLQGQGWLFSKAMPAHEALQMIADNRHLHPQVEDLDLSAMPTTPFATADWGRDGIRLRAGSSALSDALITDRQQLEIVTALLDIAPCGTFIKDAQARFVQANAQACRMYGVDSVDRVRGKTDFDLHDFQTAIRYQADDVYVLSSGKALIDRTQRHRRPDGYSALLRTSRVPIRNSQGDTIGLAGFSTELP